MTYEIKRMQFDTHNGWYEEERNNGNVWEIDVRYSLPVAETEEDDLKNVFNYESVYDTVQKEMERPCRLIETVGQNIYKSIQGIGQSQGMEDLEVRVRKLNPPFKGKTESVEVVIGK